MLLGDGLGEISACFMCSAVEKIVIPAGVRVIQAKAFNSCERLRRVAFAGDGPEAIKLYAFASSGLESFRPSIAAQAREPGLRELFRTEARTSAPARFGQTISSRKTFSGSVLWRV